MYELTKNRFEKCKKVTWDDVIDKMDHDLREDHCRIVGEGDGKFPSLFTFSNNYFPGTLYPALEEVDLQESSINSMHVYASFTRGAPTYGRHNDDTDVIIVQARGNMTYGFDDGRYAHLEPGDSLFIPAYTYHNPICNKGPRISLSFGYANKRRVTPLPTSGGIEGA
tara:strand:- start:76 stop:576 length:501 start_codon:yes stop_codon:yes gene_type:complete